MDYAIHCGLHGTGMVVSFKYVDLTDKVAEGIQDVGDQRLGNPGWYIVCDLKWRESTYVKLVALKCWCSKSMMGFGMCVAWNMLNVEQIQCVLSTFILILQYVLFVC
jgi:hypothetical protein